MGEAELSDELKNKDKVAETTRMSQKNKEEARWREIEEEKASEAGLKKKNPRWNDCW